MKELNEKMRKTEGRKGEREGRRNRGRKRETRR